MSESKIPCVTCGRLPQDYEEDLLGEYETPIEMGLAALCENDSLTFFEHPVRFRGRDFTLRLSPGNIDTTEELRKAKAEIARLRGLVEAKP